MKYSIPMLCMALFLSSVPTFAATMPSGENKASCPNGASVGTTPANHATTSDSYGSVSTRTPFSRFAHVGNG